MVKSQRPRFSDALKEAAATAADAIALTTSERHDIATAAMNREFMEVNLALDSGPRPRAGARIFAAPETEDKGTAQSVLAQIVTGRFDDLPAPQQQNDLRRLNVAMETLCAGGRNTELNDFREAHRTELDARREQVSKAQQQAAV